MREIWKDIPGFETYYEASETGKIRNKRNGRILRPFKSTNGRLMVGLSVKGDLKRYLIHRLIALTFIPNPNNLPVINHKDGNPLNNNVINLEWCTQKYNVHHSFETGLYHIRNVICMETGEVFKRAADAARKFNINSGIMSKILNGKLGSWRGLHFKHIN